MTQALKITGPDALEFLKRQASNDIKKAEKVFASFLKPKGEIVSLTVIELNAAGELIVYSKNADKLAEHLNKFLIIEDAAIETVETKEDLSALDDFEEEQSIVKLEQVKPGILDKYISFSKGCFPGQEVVSKFKNLGMKKREERSQKYTDEALEIFAAVKDFSELDPAIELLRKALKENPKNEDAYESLGVMLAKQKKFDEAIKVMHQLEMINPKNQMAQMNLSIFYMQIGNKEKAEEHKAQGTVIQFEQALKS